MRGKIREVIVVEGKKDTQAVKRAVVADTLETRGSAVEPGMIAEVKKAQERRGVIILTDPDGAGERIRRILSRQVPGCKQAFIQRCDAQGEKGLGVEHASPEVIREALIEARTEAEGGGSAVISWERYVTEGLAGGKGARILREQLAVALGIGYANAQQLFHRLHLLRVTEAEFEKALGEVKRGKDHG